MMKTGLIPTCTSFATVLAVLIVLHPSSVATVTASISPLASTAERELKHLRTRRSSGPRLLSSEEVLYQNDFENPNSPLDYNDGCGGVYDSNFRPLQRLYDTPGFEFNNRHASIGQGALSLQNSVYTNPQKIGGKYAVAISTGEIYLTFDAKGFNFVNVGMHISPTDMKGDGNCHGYLLPKNDSGTVPKIQVALYNGKMVPGYEGTSWVQKLDEEYIEGIPSEDSFRFSWTYASVSLDASSAADGFVTLRFDGQDVYSGHFGHYDAIDNLKIVGSDTPIALTAPVPDSPPHEEPVPKSNSNSTSKQRVLYLNDFENPSQVPEPSCGGSADTTYDVVNKYFSQTGFKFAQTLNTYNMELVLLNGMASGSAIYEPQGVGGKFAVGIWHKDKLALTLDSKGFRFLSIGLNLAAANLAPSCNAPISFESDNQYKPKLHVSLMDSPGPAPDMAWDFSNLEGVTPLDEGDVVGTKIDGKALESMPFTLDWTYDTVTLDSFAKSGSWVSLIFDLQGGVPYAVIDSLIVIGSSDESVTTPAAFAEISLARIPRGICAGQNLDKKPLLLATIHSDENPFKVGHDGSLPPGVDCVHDDHGTSSSEVEVYLKGKAEPTMENGQYNVQLQATQDTSDSDETIKSDINLRFSYCGCRMYRCGKDNQGFQVCRAKTPTQEAKTVCVGARKARRVLFNGGVCGACPEQHSVFGN